VLLDTPHVHLDELATLASRISWAVKKIMIAVLDGDILGSRG
jgi:hypothetical protein